MAASTSLQRSTIHRPAEAREEEETSGTILGNIAAVSICSINGCRIIFRSRDREDIDCDGGEAQFLSTLGDLESLPFLASLQDLLLVNCRALSR